MSAEVVHQRLSDAFDALQERSSDGQLRAYRKQAWESYQAVGIPTSRNEEWKYSNVASRLARVAASWQPEVPTAASPVHGLGGIRILVHKDRIQVQGTLPDGLSVEHIHTETQLQQANAGVIAEGDATTWYNPFAAINAALLSNEVVVRIAKGTHVAEFVHIVVSADSSEPDALRVPRIVVIGEQDSRCTVVTSIEAASSSSFCAGVTNVVAHSRSHVALVHVVNDPAESTQMWYTHGEVYAHGRIEATSAAFRAGFVRNDTVVRLREPGAEAYLYGVTVADGSAHVDNHTVVDHIAPHCHSEELYKGVYAGKSSGVFNGKIFVRPDAQKTTAFQANHNILLSPQAQVNTKPQLEIWADDVKCSHGATSGQLNDEAIFYLRARGIGEADARALLTYAFAADVVDHLESEAMRSWMHDRISETLGTKAFE